MTYVIGYYSNLVIDMLKDNIQSSSVKSSNSF